MICEIVKAEWQLLPVLQFVPHISRGVETALMIAAHVDRGIQQ